MICNMLKIAVLGVFLLMSLCDSYPQDGGYSFHKFSGPVSGDIQKVDVPGVNPHGNFQTVDYVAKPDYTYAYGVEDPHTGNKQRRQETRDGDSVQGEYSLVEPDGTLRVVRYTADKLNGFQVNVEYIRPEE